MEATQLPNFNSSVSSNTNRSSGSNSARRIARPSGSVIPPSQSSGFPCNRLTNRPSGSSSVSINRSTNHSSGSSSISNNPLANRSSRSSSNSVNRSTSIPRSTRSSESTNQTNGASIRQSVNQSSNSQPQSEFSVLVRLQRESLENTKRLESKIDKIGTALSDLKKIVEENEKKNFSIKECGYEGELRCVMAELFCTSVSRYPSATDLEQAIKSVLSREHSRKKHILTSALKSCKEFLSTFRTEVLGMPPYERSACKSTEDLCREIIHLCKAPDTVYPKYIRHLALLRKYVKETPQSKTMLRFHDNAKEWLTQSLSEDEWKIIMDEDIHHPYSEYPTSKPPEVETNSPPQDISPYDSTGPRTPDSEYRFGDDNVQYEVEMQGDKSD